MEISKELADEIKEVVQTEVRKLVQDVHRAGYLAGFNDARKEDAAELASLRMELAVAEAIVAAHRCNRCGQDGGVYPTPLQRIAGWKGRLCSRCRAQNPNGEGERPPKVNFVDLKG